MSELPTGKDPDDDIDERYRRASALDPGRPAESVRRAVLAHAAQVAAQRAARRSRWRPAVFGTLAAAALAGLLITPHFLPPRETSEIPARPAKTYSMPLTPAANPAPAPTAAPTAAPPVAAQATQADAMSAPSPSAGARSEARQALAPMAIGGHPMDPATSLWRAAESGDLPALQALLSANIDINARDASGRTALMLAVLGRHASAVEALLARGADPNVADARGTTPLQAALAADEPATVTALQRAGAR
ncbi:MAG: ankyrin repeat domain-containing protein [Steroidobacterales bacterium]